MKYRILLIAVGLSVVPMTQAASFNCAKASSNIEKAICADVELSKLDGELSSIYRDVLAEADEQEKQEIRNKQHQWLATRDRCNQDQVRCLTQVYRARNAELRTSYSKARTERMLNNELPELSQRTHNSIENIKDALEDCNASQRNMNICSYLYSVDAELALEAEFAKALEQLSPECRDKLKAIQTKWKKEMMKQCEEEATDVAEGGSMYPTLANSCVENAIKLRTSKIRHMISCDSKMTR